MIKDYFDMIECPDAEHAPSGSCPCRSSQPYNIQHCIGDTLFELDL